MKCIGTAVDGNTIVSMSSAEVSAFQALALAVEGEDMWGIQFKEFGMRPLDTFDMANVFEVIHAFATTKSVINSLSRVVKKVERSMDLGDEE